MKTNRLHFNWDLMKKFFLYTNSFGCEVGFLPNGVHLSEKIKIRNPFERNTKECNTVDGSMVDGERKSILFQNI